MSKEQKTKKPKGKNELDPDETQQVYETRRTWITAAMGFGCAVVGVVGAGVPAHLQNGELADQIEMLEAERDQLRNDVHKLGCEVGKEKWAEGVASCLKTRQTALESCNSDLATIAAQCKEDE